MDNFYGICITLYIWNEIINLTKKPQSTEAHEFLLRQGFSKEQVKAITGIPPINLKNVGMM